MTRRYTALFASFFVFHLLLLFSCTERIHIDTKNAPEHLVIYGYITDETSRHMIRLTRSGGYFTASKPEGVRGAEVVIQSGEETFVLTESADDPGLYMTDADVTGLEGENYTLSISVDFDDDGEREEFEASSYLPYAIRLDSIGLRESVVIDNAVEVLLYGKMPDNEENYLSIHAFRNDYMVNDSLHGFFIISDEHLNMKEFTGTTCFFFDRDGDEEYNLEPGDTVSLSIDMVTKEYADFLEHAGQEARGSIPLFGGPPANVETNIQSKHNPRNIPVVGFFSAFSHRKASKVYK